MILHEWGIERLNRLRELQSATIPGGNNRGRKAVWPLYRDATGKSDESFKPISGAAKNVSQPAATAHKSAECVFVIPRGTSLLREAAA